MSKLTDIINFVIYFPIINVKRDVNIMRQYYDWDEWVEFDLSLGASSESCELQATGWTENKGFGIERWAVFGEHDDFSRYEVYDYEAMKDQLRIFSSARIQS